MWVVSLKPHSVLLLYFPSLLLHPMKKQKEGESTIRVKANGIVRKSLFGLVSVIVLWIYLTMQSIGARNTKTWKTDTNTYVWVFGHGFCCEVWEPESIWDEQKHKYIRVKEWVENTQPTCIHRFLCWRKSQMVKGDFSHISPSIKLNE